MRNPTFVLVCTFLIQTGSPSIFGACGVLFAQITDAERHANKPPLIETYCSSCHSGEDAEGGVNLGQLDFKTQGEDSTSFAAHFELLRRAAELLAERSMPPREEPQPSAAERKQFEEWFEDNFVRRIEARPAHFRVRRLSAHEYRNTLSSLMGFDMEVNIVEAEQTLSEKSLVMKLLPIDPPGPSGFTNDTSENPLTTVLWDQYSRLADAAIDSLLTENKSQLPFSTQEVSADRLIEFLVEFRERAFRRRFTQDANSRYEEELRLQLEVMADSQQLLRQELKVVLMSPAFLHRGLLSERPAEQTIVPVDAFELAERLSYFLWADMPDAKLLESASNNSLLRKDILSSHVSRMLQHEKARNLAEDFATQWFSLNEIEKASNNPPVMLALKSQPIDFLHYLFSEDRPLLELLDSEVTFINPHTSKYYRSERGQLEAYRKQKGIEVEALPNQRIKLTATPERGGLLTMPGILAMNRGPILRGTWLLERILGEHLPDPPPDVPPVPPSPKGQNLSFRDRFELHRSQTSCAVCHDKIDPLGFSLEAYDNNGSFKKSAGYQPSKKDLKRGLVIENNPVTAGKLPSGENFQDFAELKVLLIKKKRRDIVENITRRTMEYALCRRLEYFDRPTVDAIVDELMTSEGGSFHQLIHLVTESLPFTHMLAD